MNCPFVSFSHPPTLPSSVPVENEIFGKWYLQRKTTPKPMLRRKPFREEFQVETKGRSQFFFSGSSINHFFRINDFISKTHEYFPKKCFLFFVKKVKFPSCDVFWKNEKAHF